jgi:hypothetical protein
LECCASALIPGQTSKIAAINNLGFVFVSIFGVGFFESGMVGQVPWLHLMSWQTEGREAENTPPVALPKLSRFASHQNPIVGQV